MTATVATPRNPWWMVMGAVLGLILSNGPVMQFSFGVFIKPLAADLGSDRGTISAALLLSMCCTGVGTPIVGWLIDRFGARAVSVPAIALFAVGMASLGLAQTPTQFILLYGVTGIFAAGQTPLPYARAVAGAFEKRRGLALGISMAGVGIGTALLPQVAQALVSRFDWRTAYVLVGAGVFILAVPSMAFLVGVRQTPTSPSQRDAVQGMRASEACRTATFGILLASFFLVSLTTAGVIAHIIPLLTDVGVQPATAASALGIAGLALIVGRLIAGYMLDRVYAPYVALVFFAAPLAGIVLLLVSASVPVALCAAMLVGLGIGAEVDLMAYLISRYFGMRAFGQIYGYLLAVFMVGNGVGPFLMGVTFNWTGTYAPALVVFAALLLVVCVMMLRLGAYVFGVRSLPAGAATSA